MSDYEFWKFAYSLGWATKEQLQEAVRVGSLTQEQYEELIQ